VTGSGALHQLAGWELPELRAGIGRLGGVAERIAPWRARLDELGRQLGTAECWSGPAGSVAAAALVELSTVASGVSGALAESMAELESLAASAADAQELAAGALATAGAAGIALDDAGQPVGMPPLPGPGAAAVEAAEVLADRNQALVAAARAQEALAAATRARAAAVAAHAPLTAIGVLGSASVDFADLAVRLAPPATGTPPPLPRGLGPQGAAGWWAELTAAEQLAEIAAHPREVGALDGLPAWAHDRANRLLLDDALRDLPEGEQRRMAEEVARRLAAEDDAGRTAQLLQFDPAGDLVAVSLGDVDTAAAVGVLVPGVGNTPADDLGNLLGSARDVGSAAGAATPGLAVATVAWLGYRTPAGVGALSENATRQGGPALDRALDGLAAARSQQGPAPRTTVLAHSYGSVVAGQAALAPGELAADALVLLGSPGTGVNGADQLEADEVFGGWSPADWISYTDYYGGSPFDSGFGDLPLPTEFDQTHSEYYDPDRPTLAAIGEVVAGTRDGG